MCGSRVKRPSAGRVAPGFHAGVREIFPLLKQSWKRRSQAHRHSDHAARYFLALRPRFNTCITSPCELARRRQRGRQPSPHSQHMRVNAEIPHQARLHRRPDVSVRTETLRALRVGAMRHWACVIVSPVSSPRFLTLDAQLHPTLNVSLENMALGMNEAVFLIELRDAARRVLRLQSATSGMCFSSHRAMSCRWPPATQAALPSAVQQVSSQRNAKSEVTDQRQDMLKARDTRCLMPKCKVFLWLTSTLSSALQEMFKTSSICTNTCINPPLYGHPDALMNPWKIPDLFRNPPQYEDETLTGAMEPVLKVGQGVTFPARAALYLTPPRARTCFPLAQPTQARFRPASSELIAQRLGADQSSDYGKRFVREPTRAKRGEYRAAPERKGEGNGRSPREPADQRHISARFPHAEIRAVTPSGIELGSFWWELSMRLIALASPEVLWRYLVAWRRRRSLGVLFASALTFNVVKSFRKIKYGALEQPPKNHSCLRASQQPLQNSLANDSPSRKAWSRASPSNHADSLALAGEFRRQLTGPGAHLVRGAALSLPDLGFRVFEWLVSALESQLSARVASAATRGSSRPGRRGPSNSSRRGKCAKVVAHPFLLGWKTLPNLCGALSFCCGSSPRNSPGSCLRDQRGAPPLHFLDGGLQFVNVRELRTLVWRRVMSAKFSASSNSKVLFFYVGQVALEAQLGPVSGDLVTTPTGMTATFSQKGIAPDVVTAIGHHWDGTPSAWGRYKPL
ncbi:hypothetical protein PR048_003430 [Dryococelus australis]|uniref:Uncharacterized protein n=1 Tax=Dryococelus australis TaxID=614101 RepID=A0ABQ9IMY8_9NEOP|nr:hypothetical protein PR048_003430 [Dryococelus australis]